MIAVIASGFRWSTWRKIGQRTGSIVLLALGRVSGLAGITIGSEDGRQSDGALLMSKPRAITRT